MELNGENDEDNKVKTGIKGHENIKEIWKVVQKKNTKEKRWKDEKVYGEMGKESRHLEDGLLQDEW